MSREDEIEIARRFTEWIEYTANLYLTDENDVLSVVKSVLSEIDDDTKDKEREEKLKDIMNLIDYRFDTEDREWHIWATGAFFVLCELGFVNENGELIEADKEREE